MTNDQNIEEFAKAVKAQTEARESLGRRVLALEQRFAEFIDSFSSADAEEEYMEERQRWVDSCRERAAEKRRTS